MQPEIIKPIGVIHSKYMKSGDAPFQGRHQDDPSTLEVFEEFEPGLKDIETCSHLIVLYLQDRGNRNNLQNKTPWGPEIHGVFCNKITEPSKPHRALHGGAYRKKRQAPDCPMDGRA